MNKNGSLDKRVREHAQGKKLGRFNLRQFASKKETHVDVCKRLVALSDANGGYPIGYLVYFAVGKNAHRTFVFDDGYKSINEDKAKTILEWLKTFSEQNGNPKLFRNADVAHAFCHIYDKVTQDFDEFRKIISRVPISPKVENYKSLIKAMGI